jgi:hypothetical protein
VTIDPSCADAEQVPELAPLVLALEALPVPA